MSTPSTPSGGPTNLRGAVDLSALKRSATAGPPDGAPAAPPAGGEGPATSGAAPGAVAGAGPAGGPDATEGGSPFVTTVDERAFEQLLRLSGGVPVVVDLGATWSPISQELTAILEKVVSEYSGRLLLAKVDVDASPQIAQAFALQSVPTVVALLKGRPLPLFQGSLPEDQVRAYLEELLKVAAANGVTGSMEQDNGEAAEEPPLPPLHQEAFDAIQAGDLDAAADAYRRALAESPADADAKAGLAQVELMLRVQGMDPQSVRSAAADNPDDVDAQLAVADLDLSGGHVEDAFARLVAFIGRHFAAERETARARLVELFDVVGPTDERVVKARAALARALF